MSVTSLVSFLPLGGRGEMEWYLKIEEIWGGGGECYLRIEERGEIIGVTSVIDK